MPATLDPPRPSVPVQDEADALFEEARRRQRRRRRGIAVALVAAALATALLLQAGGSGPRPPHSAARPGHAHSRPVAGASHALAVLPGADANLLIWPAAVKPITISRRSLQAERVFYERHPATTSPARIVNLDTGRSVVRPVPGLLRDEPSLLPVGHWLVYNSTKGVAIIRSDLRGAPRVIGHADWFVPGVNDQIWLVEGLGGSLSAPVRVQGVSVPSGKRGPKVALPKHTEEVVEGTVRGLLLFVGTQPIYRLELWKPGSAPVVLANKIRGPGSLFAVDSQIVAFGSACNPSGELNAGESCARLNLINLQHGYRWSLTAPGATQYFDAGTGTGGWVPPVSSAAAQSSLISPNRRLLAAAAVVPQEEGLRIREGPGQRTGLYLVNLSPANLKPAVVPRSITTASRRIAWTPHGDWLLYTSGVQRYGSEVEGAWRLGSELRAYSLGGSTRPTSIPCCQFTSMLSVP
jgi:hypothetical protein